MERMIKCDNCGCGADYASITNIFDVRMLCEDCAVEYVMDNYIFEKSKTAKPKVLCEKCGSGNPLHYVFDEEYKEENEIPYNEVCYQCAYKYGKKELLNYCEKI